MKRQRGVNYALMTAAAAVVGLLLLRAIFTSHVSLRTDFVSNRFTYAYIFVATAGTFLVLGYVLGRQADELRRVSTTDSLTGLFNRRAMNDRLQHEWRRSSRYHTPLALLLIDIDGLKRINDEWGHRGGDRLLRSTATAIRETLRTTDVGARWGGDEFAIVAPQTSRDAARRLAERLLTQLKNQKDYAPGGIAASVGVAVFESAQDAGKNLDWLMRCADGALYSAKSGGRNQVKVAEIRPLRSRWRRERLPNVSEREAVQNEPRRADYTERYAKLRRFSAP
jgi:diguanylate cyclase (GGDEF)-like protein